LKKCNNFKKLYLHVPLLGFLFEKTDLQFIEESINEEYNKNYIINIINILLCLPNKISDKEYKIIFSLILFDFIMKNIKFLINNNNFAKVVILKFEEFLKDSDYILIIKKFNIDYVKWYEIMSDAIEN
jgi:hypothetical protein